MLNTSLCACWCFINTGVRSRWLTSEWTRQQRSWKPFNRLENLALCYLRQRKTKTRLMMEDSRRGWEEWAVSPAIPWEPGLSKVAKAKALPSVVINRLIIVIDDGATLTAKHDVPQNKEPCLSATSRAAHGLCSNIIIFYRTLVIFPSPLPAEGFLAAALLKDVPEEHLMLSIYLMFHRRSSH